MDFLRRGRIQLCAIKFIVLDEADRMLDMGFLPEIEKLMGDSSMSEKVGLLINIILVMVNSIA